MVLISEITDGAPNEGEEAEEDRAELTGERGPEEPQAVENSVPDASSSGQTLCNEYAMRVAYIMRSYLSMRHAAAAAGEAPPTPLAGERCKAMLEVVRKEHGKWAVSKLVAEHNHELSPSPAGDGGVVAPAMGTAFESVEAAKVFYHAYGEKTGFKAQTGSNRRSGGNGALIMQRFLCWRGNYVNYKKNSDGPTRKRKRGPYRKRARKLADEAETEVSAKKGGDVVEVIEVESSTEKLGVGGDDRGGEVQSGAPAKEAATEEKDACQKAPSPVVEPGSVDAEKDGAQSRLLRELGIRVSRYNNEERRDIILKYMMKRDNRQVVETQNKVPSRQALVERLQREIRGRFRCTNELQTSNRQEVMTEADSDNPAADVAIKGGEPKVGLAFANEDKAYEFYVKYAGNVGFSVRKGWWDKSARNVTRSRVYVCSREGFRPKNTANEAKKPRPETRTGCPAHMAIKITPCGKYCVSEFVADHNHQLAAPLDIQMLKSQRLLAKAQPEDCQNACLIPVDYKNYLRSKRAKDMRVGDAGAMLEYLQKMKGDDPSFFYAIQVDEDDQLTNIFWADAKSMTNYFFFGDAVCFDTTYKASDYGRPFAQFLGVNHHKQIVFFGATLLYDESVESLKWLFETFSTAMCGKQPMTILTDRSEMMTDAIAAVWPGTVHRLCVWHLFQNVAKHLSHVSKGSETFSHDISTIIYDYDDDEVKFLSAWRAMLEKYALKNDKWLAKLFDEREKWALVYGRQAFCADMKSTLRNESFGTVLKEYLSLEKDLPSFFKKYEKLLDERRYAELQADYHASQATSRIPPLRLLWQAANAYTPTIFEMFRVEFELFMNCMVYSCGVAGTISKYEVTVKEKAKEHYVRFDSSDNTVTCSCKKFESFGVQCCHVLKVLVFNNVKELPPQYILKRWRKDAKAGSMRENHGFALDGDPKSALPKRYSSLCRVLYKIAAKAAENVAAYAFLESQSDQLLEQVERILQTRILEKPPLNTVVKGPPQNPVVNEGACHDNNSEPQGVSGKKDGGVRRRHQSQLEVNKRQKGRKGQSDEAEVAPRDDEPPMAPNTISCHLRSPSSQFFAPSQFMQVPYVPAHQFGLVPLQGFHGLNHFSQNAVQACPTAPDMHSLQFIGAPSAAQLGHQSNEQGHYIPEGERDHDPTVMDLHYGSRSRIEESDLLLSRCHIGRHWPKERFTGVGSDIDKPEAFCR